MLRAPSLAFSSSRTLLPASEGRRDKKNGERFSPERCLRGNFRVAIFCSPQALSLRAGGNRGMRRKTDCANSKPTSKPTPAFHVVCGPPPSPRAASKMSSRARDSTKSRRSLQRRNGKTLHVPAVGSVPPPPDGLHVAPSRRTRGDHLERGAKVCGSSAQT